MMQTGATTTTTTTMSLRRECGGRGGGRPRCYTTHSSLPEEHRMVYDMCRNVADEVLAPNAGTWDQKHEFPTNAIQQLVCIYIYVNYPPPPPPPQ